MRHILWLHIIIYRDNPPILCSHRKSSCTRGAWVSLSMTHQQPHYSNDWSNLFKCSHIILFIHKNTHSDTHSYTCSMHTCIHRQSHAIWELNQRVYLCWLFCLSTVLTYFYFFFIMHLGSHIYILIKITLTRSFLSQWNSLDCIAFGHKQMSTIGSFMVHSVLFYFNVISILIQFGFGSGSYYHMKWKSNYISWKLNL